MRLRDIIWLAFYGAVKLGDSIKKAGNAMMILDTIGDKVMLQGLGVNK